MLHEDLKWHCQRSFQMTTTCTMSSVNSLTHSLPVPLQRQHATKNILSSLACIEKMLREPLLFFTHWELLKTSAFLMFSWGIDRTNFHAISYGIANKLGRLEPRLLLLEILCKSVGTIGTSPLTSTGQIWHCGQEPPAVWVSSRRRILLKMKSFFDQIIDCCHLMWNRNLYLNK